MTQKSIIEMKPLPINIYSILNKKLQNGLITEEEYNLIYKSHQECMKKKELYKSSTKQ